MLGMTRLSPPPGRHVLMYLKDSEKVVSISSEHLEPITPTKNNKVREGKGTLGASELCTAVAPDPCCPPAGEGDPG